MKLSIFTPEKPEYARRARIGSCVLLNTRNLCRALFRAVMYAFVALPVLAADIPMAPESHPEPENYPKEPGSRDVSPRLPAACDTGKQLRELVLPNGLLALLVADAGADKARVALRVDVGSQQDPDEFPGMAHFVEHMLFLGSSEFPLAGAYNRYLSHYSGRSNALTDYQHTIYHFSVLPEGLRGALKRFSSQFKGPLFDEKYLDQELSAVDSEYHYRSDFVYWQLIDVVNEVIQDRQKHPYARFSIGNRNTLKVDRETVMNWWKTHYSADGMHLVVTGNHSLDELEAWVKEDFSAIPVRERSPQALPVLDNSALVPGLANAHLGEHQWEMVLKFPLKNREGLLGSPAVAYLKYLLGQSMPGSIETHLRGYEYANGLTLDVEPVDESTVMMSVHFNLQYSGGRKYWDTIKRFLAYADLLREKPLEPWRWEEFNNVQASRWCYDNDSSALTWVKHYPRYGAEGALTGASAGVEPLDQAHLDALLSALRADNMLIVRSDSEASVDRRSPWFHTEFAFEPLDEGDVRNYVASAEERKRFYLYRPNPNPFVSDQKVVGADEDLVAPVRIQAHPAIEAWYGHREDLRSPLSRYYLLLSSPVAEENQKNAAQMTLMHAMLREQLSQDRAAAGDIGVKSDIARITNGLQISLLGPANAVETLLERMLGRVAEFRVRDRDFRSWQYGWMEWLKSSEELDGHFQASDRLSALVWQPDWDNGDLLRGMRAATRETMGGMLEDWRRSLTVKSLAYGNVGRKQASHWNHLVAEKLLTDSEPRKSHEFVTQVPIGIHRLILETDYSDSFALNYIQGHDESLSEHAQFQLLSQMVSSEFFHSLRTEGQLGYSIGTGVQQFLNRPGLTLQIQSPYSSVNRLDAAIEQFKKDFLVALYNMPEAEFGKHRDSQIRQLRRKPKDLDVQSYRMWEAIRLGHHDFDRSAEMARALESVNKEGFKNWYNQRFLTGARNVSVLVEGQRHEVDGYWRDSVSATLLDSVRDFHKLGNRPD